MQLPEKTFLTNTYQLAESDFEYNGQVKPLRIMQFLQDIATDHAQVLGLGWQEMNSHDLLWILAKVKIVFCTPITRQVKNFTLYTWPLTPARAFAERCFVAVQNGQELFSATSMWTIINRDSRKILPAETMCQFFKGEFSQVHSTASAEYTRVKLDSDFEFCYTTTVRRSDLDLNGHVNNTNYITYAMDVLAPDEKVSELEIAYHRELKLGNTLQLFCRRQQNKVFVVGQSVETCFTAVLTLI